MLGSSYDYAWGSRPGDFHNVASTPLFGNCSDPAVVSSMRHALLDCGVDHYPDSLTGIVSDEQTSQRLLSSVTGLSSEQSSVLRPKAL